jgi:hypothetical protein
MTLLLVVASLTSATAQDLTVDRDNTIIDRSCRVVIPAGKVIADADGDGVIHIKADGITIEFAEGSVLEGAGPDVADDALTGLGIRLDGHKDVTIRGPHIRGYKCGLHASNADGLTIDGLTVDRNFRQRLLSTPLAENLADWLRPHRNDRRQWMTSYGAAAYLERSRDITVRNTLIRNSQNGLILDRVEHSRIYDNDCSFLSGWGLAMWRSSHNLISRNALDFCIRGYSHGVYNRGQDSAGILCFEQCSNNAFIENSATHGGDGFFGFLGREALGESRPPEDGWDYTGRGCNNNVFLRNDFSDAAAHGIEITFSFDNQIFDNALNRNGICGIWGGYSQRTRIVGNTIESNGQPGLREGGGINIEHGHKNVISTNRFARNSVAVALWSDDDGELLSRPWAKANHRGSSETLIARNSFTDEASFLRLRETSGTRLELNTFTNTTETIDTDDKSEVSRIESAADATPPPEPPTFPEPLGQKRPVGARPGLAGREHILMGPWGPWDHQSPMLRLATSGSDRLIYELLGQPGPVTLDLIEGKGDLETQLGEVEEGQPRTLLLTPRPGISVLPFAVRVRARAIDETVRGTLIRTAWIATIFPFTVDPRADLVAWRAESRAATGTVTIPCDDLGWMRFNGRGPRDLPFLREAADRLPGNSRFGVIARTRINLPAGRWRFTTVSDDGVRVLVGKPGGPAPSTVIENWTHHAAARDRGVFEQAEPGEVEITVEYFQLDGGSTLEYSMERVEDSVSKPATPATSVP